MDMLRQLGDSWLQTGWCSGVSARPSGGIKNGDQFLNWLVLTHLTRSTSLLGFLLWRQASRSALVLLFLFRTAAGLETLFLPYGDINESQTGQMGVCSRGRAWDGRSVNVGILQHRSLYILLEHQAELEGPA